MYRIFKKQLYFIYVVPRCPKYLLCGHIARGARPRTNVHHHNQLNPIQCWQHWCKEQAQPYHSLVVDYMKHVLGHFELTVFWLYYSNSYIKKIH